jgi:AcrR family transcriptional regulator
MPNVTRKQKLATRQALVTAAARLIADGGLDACTVAAVAREVGVTGGAVYSNFPSLLHLQVEAHAELQDGWLPRLDPALALGEAVRRFVEAYTAVWREPTARPVLVAGMLLAARHLEDPTLLAHARERLEGTTSALAAALEASAAVGGQRLSMPPRRAAVAFQGIVSGLGDVAGIAIDLVDVDLVVETVLAAILDRPST